IFDPGTGNPADSGLLSVTVVTQYGYVSDALSTACFVLGIEKSIPLLEKYNAEAVFITEDKEIITTYGESESKILTVTNDEYRLGELK
ncbi:MAG: FAD:protein FMN transferase, partial [Clostridia bacterium]|nr:FAD:protein FMN transferase [Clostridia bacterium]